MSTEPTTEPAGERRDEVEELRERVAALELELADRAARANEALAAAQDRTYWLDRWHFDLNAFMRRPIAARLWLLMPAARATYRGARKGRELLQQTRRERTLAASREDSGALGLGTRSFRRAVAPSQLRSAEVTDLLLAQVDPADLEELERRLAPEEAALLETAGDLDRRRFLLSFGVHHELPGVLDRTGLRPDSPPADVHAMGRGPAAAGGSLYYADLVSDALRSVGAPLAAGQRALDFGCSSGRVVRVLAAAHPELEWHGCDPIPGAIDWAREHLGGIAFEHSTEAPPLPYEPGAFDSVFAISIWSHFSPTAALEWLREMQRILKPSGHLVLTTHGHTTLAHEEAGRIRGTEQLEEIERALYEHGVWFKNEFGPQGDHGVANPDWGTAFLTPEWLLAHATPDWEVVAYAPGRVEGSQDLYVLRRRR
jgi:SAM-dependent methyltransferase